MNELVPHVVEVVLHEVREQIRQIGSRCRPTVTGTRFWREHRRVVLPVSVGRRAFQPSLIAVVPAPTMKVIQSREVDRLSEVVWLGERPTVEERSAVVFVESFREGANETDCRSPLSVVLTLQFSKEASNILDSGRSTPGRIPRKGNRNGGRGLLPESSEHPLEL